MQPIVTTSHSEQIYMKRQCFNIHRYWHLNKRRKPIIKYAYQQGNAADFLIFVTQTLNLKDKFYQKFFRHWDNLTLAQKHTAEALRVCYMYIFFSI